MSSWQCFMMLHDFMIPGASHIEVQVKSLDAVLHSSTWLVQEFTGGMLMLILSSAPQKAIIFFTCIYTAYIYIMFVYNDDKHLQFQRFFEQETRLGFIVSYGH